MKNVIILGFAWSLVAATVTNSATTTVADKVSVDSKDKYSSADFSITGLTDVTLLEDDFEETVDWDANWDENGITDWYQTNYRSVSGNYSARADQGDEGYLTSDSSDASDADSITVDFWFRKSNLESSDFTLFFYNGSNYVQIAELDGLAIDNDWVYYTKTTTDSQYFVSNFRIRLDATLSSAEVVYVDDVLITKQSGWPRISGHITDSNGGYVEGIEVSADNGGESDTTDPNGYYKFRVPYDWSGIVTPGKTDWGFNPENRTYENVISDMPNQDFLLLPQPTISGYIMDANGIGIEGVMVAADSGDLSDISETDGYYEITVRYNWSGTVTPDKIGLRFNPESRVYDNLVFEQTGQNYTSIVFGPIFVDQKADGNNEGSSWVNAYNSLQDALATALKYDEILVAYGTYRPDQGEGVTPSNRGETFQMIDWVTIKGGYAGFGEPDPNVRNVEFYETILSGDLDANDGPDFANYGDNSSHVVVGSGTDATAVLDGFTISGGNGAGGGMYNNNGSPTVLNCTLENNLGGDGGGMFNVNSGPTLVGCTFINNSGRFGGGMRNNVSGPTLVDCTFIRNSGRSDGGGVSNWTSNVKFINCKFIGNSTNSNGGGINNIDCSPTLVNCLFIGNSALGNGGGMYNGRISYESRPTLTNCTFSGNRANQEAGGIYSHYVYNMQSFARLRNCILWGNSDSGGMDESGQIYDRAPGPVISYTCIQGSTNTEDGNISDDPLFVDPDGVDNVVGTGDDDLRLLPGSACVDAGNNNAVPADVADLDEDGDTDEPIPLDIDGNWRFADEPDTPDTGNGIAPIVDMGVYENPGHDFLLNTPSVIVPEGGTQTFTVSLLNDPCGVAEVIVENCLGDSDIVVESGATLTFDSSNYWIPQMVTLGAMEDEDQLNDTAIICVSAPGFGTAGIRATELDNEPNPNILFVDANAQGMNNGMNWTDAFNNLQDAIGIAGSYTQFEEIRVAQGIYTPAEPSGDQAAAFQLMNGVLIKGGYAGFGEPDPNALDIKVYKTILSGDLNGNDDPDFANYGDNSSHVVVGSGTDATAVLNGFTISGGNGAGGGMYNNNGSPTVLNCTLENNHGGDGGGMYNSYSSAMVKNCVFKNNYGSRGGGIFNLNSTSNVINCDFISNESHGWLNGGGGAHNSNSSATFTNCSFISNWSYYEGGGMRNDWGSHAMITNCLFSGNTTDEYGGGLACSFSNPTLTNCTFVGNRATGYGSGINAFSSCTPTVRNCILWANGSSSQRSQIYTVYEVVNYCCIQGLTGSFGGIGNIATDPCFVMLGYWDDDEWIDGDYYLKSEGWRWDADANQWSWDEVTSRCIDAGNPGSELGDEAVTLDVDPLNRWGENIRINMGVYGGIPKASMPPYDWALLADLTNDGIVGFEDLVGQVANWLDSESEQPGDLNCDGVVNMTDFALLATDWLKTTSWY